MATFHYSDQYLLSEYSNAVQGAPCGVISPSVASTSWTTSEVSQTSAPLPPQQQKSGLVTIAGHSSRLVTGTSVQSSAESTKESPLGFGCTLCSRQFKTKWNAEKHLKVVHMKELCFACDVCGRSFGARSNLQRHKRDVHAKIRAHACDICGQAFGQRATLKRHLSLRHKCVVDGNAFVSYRLKEEDVDGASGNNMRVEDQRAQVSSFALKVEHEYANGDETKDGNGDIKVPKVEPGDVDMLGLKPIEGFEGSQDSKPVVDSVAEWTRMSMVPQDEEVAMMVFNMSADEIFGLLCTNQL